MTTDTYPEDALLILRYAREVIERRRTEEPPSASRPAFVAPKETA